METTTSPEVSVNFDELSRAAYAKSASLEEKDQLWKAILSLEDWLFIARGTFPEIHPYVCSNPTVAEGQYFLKAFTDPTRLQAFAIENQLTADDGSVNMLVLPVGGLVANLSAYEASGVHGIHFNANSESQGFYAPLRQIGVILRHLESRGFQRSKPPVAPAEPQGPPVIRIPRRGDLSGTRGGPTPEVTRVRF